MTLAVASTPRDFSAEQIDLIKQTVAAGTSDLELALFLEVAKSSGLKTASQTCYTPKQQCPGGVGSTPERGPFREGQMDSTKVCRDCGKAFPATREYFHSRGQGKLNTYCKGCAGTRAKAHHEANRDHKLRLMAEYRAENRDTINAQIRQLRARNPEAKAAADSDYRQRNAERISARHQRYYRANQQRFVEKARSWALLNPEKTRAHTRAKNHRRRGAAMDADAKTYAAILTNDPCCYCGSYGGGVEIDHIIPLANGGTGSWENLTRACRTCNGTKTDKSLLTFLMERAL